MAGILTPQIVSEVMRHRLGDISAERSARILTGIPEALKATARKIAANRDLRHIFSKSVTSALTSGSVDINTLAEANSLLTEYTDKWLIYLQSNQNYALKRIPAAAKTLPMRFVNYNFYYIEGTSLCVRDASGSPASGSIIVKGSYYPTTLAELGVKEVQDIFFNKLYEWCLSDTAPGADAAEDGAR